MSERVRVQKAIAHAGLMSRRAAEQAISEGRVRVNGELVGLGDRVDVETDRLTVDGIAVPVNPETRTYLVYKPIGVVSTASDPHGRPTVVDLVPSDTRLYPVGRLDSDSEGLILVSNDGDLTNIVTHPSHGITKTYIARVEGRPTKGTLRRIHAGVELEDGPARAESARILDTHGDETLVELVMTEGRNREVRRMMSAVGHEVRSLVRTAIGPLRDQSLKPGEARELTAEEINTLLTSARIE